MSNARQTVRRLLEAAVAAAKAEGLVAQVPANIAVERPKRREHGDFASNVALATAAGAALAPRAIAESIAAHLRALGAEDIAEATVAGPGFINVRLSDGYWQAALGDVLAAGADWGRGSPRASPRVLLEYVSSNPTGPLHVGHGRIAAVGDSLARLLRFAGYEVAREFYVNDAGNQVDMLARSVWSRYVEAAAGAGVATPAAPFPEGGYRGDYVRDFGRELWERDGPRWLAAERPADFEPIKRFAIDRSLALVRATLGRFGVEFEKWQSEQALHEAGDVAQTLSALEAAGYIDRKENAVWLKTTALWGDEKDRVVVKSDGAPTYLLADIAYHRKKVERGFDELVDIWGADHHGHIARMKAALKAFAIDPGRLHVMLIQTVRLLREGQEVKMGKRSGEFVTLDEVIDEVGLDATRFFYVMRRHDTGLDFDLDLARRQAMDNPVYYAQYAHARCASLQRRARELQAPRIPFSVELAKLLTLSEEISILRRLADFPDLVAEAAAAREPHRLVAYIQELAGEFQSAYTQLQKVHGDTILPQERQRVGDWRSTWDWHKTAARLYWAEAIRQVLETALSLLGVSAPERMERTPDGEEA